MAVLRVDPTAALSPRVLEDLRRLLERDAFADDFDDHDWAHALGGSHVWLEEATAVISHASVVERTLTCAGRRLRVGYVEAVATAAAHRRQGHGSTVMSRVNELIRKRYPLGALSSGLAGFYERLGWERWRGPTFVEGPQGVQRTPDDDAGVLILRTPASPPLDLDGPIVCDWRPGDVW